MLSLLLALVLALSPLAQAGCEEVDTALLEGHVGRAHGAWRSGDDAGFARAHALILDDLACLAGSGLKTRSTDLFLVLARGALEQGDDARALAALRALLVIDQGFTPELELVPLDTPLAPLFAMAQVLGPEVAGFKALYLGQQPAPPAAPEPPSAAQLEALRRERFLTELRAEMETDAKAHRAGVITAVIGGTACGVSLSIIAARNTSGASKPVVEQRIHRETWAKVWTGTAITGGATMGVGLWLMHVSQLDGGAAMPGVGWGWRF
jgi:hypothetical protein